MIDMVVRHLILLASGPTSYTGILAKKLSAQRHQQFPLDSLQLSGPGPQLTDLTYSRTLAAVLAADIVG